MKLFGEGDFEVEVDESSAESFGDTTKYVLSSDLHRLWPQKHVFTQGGELVRWRDGENVFVVIEQGSWKCGKYIGMLISNHRMVFDPETHQVVEWTLENEQTAVVFLNIHGFGGGYVWGITPDCQIQFFDEETRRVVEWMLEDGTTFVSFPNSEGSFGRCGKYVGILVNDQFRFFDPETRRVVEWMLEDGEVAKVVQGHYHNDNGLVCLTFSNNQWHRFDPETRREVIGE